MIEMGEKMFRIPELRKTDLKKLFTLRSLFLIIICDILSLWNISLLCLDLIGNEIVTYIFVFLLQNIIAITFIYLIFKPVLKRKEDP